ncbi:MAG TPA: histidine kinase [Rugosimonospora sp.]|nr:histidine kinase [Rugosimonospora sp.]
MIRVPLRIVVLDAGLVVVAAVDILVMAEDPRAFTLAAVGALAVAVRRYLPYVAFALTLPTLVFSAAMVAALITLFTVAAHTRRRPVLLGCILLFGAAYTLPWPPPGMSFNSPGEILVSLVYTTGTAAAPVFLGQLVRTRRELSQRLREIGDARHYERLLTAQTVLATERAQLAREMHDVVSHQVSLIAVRAGALQVSAASPQTRDAASTIRELSVKTLEELRHMVTVLRASGSPRTELTPQPTLAQLEQLVANSGIDAKLTAYPPPDVPPPVQRTIYRTVQEALTNVRKHAPGASATVEIDHDGRAISVVVTNTAPTRPTLPLPSARHGLVGLRERADILGGTIAYGPTADAGYQLRVRLPWT